MKSYTVVTTKSFDIITFAFFKRKKQVAVVTKGNSNILIKAKFPVKIMLSENKADFLEEG